MTTNILHKKVARHRVPGSNPGKDTGSQDSPQEIRSTVIEETLFAESRVMLSRSSFHSPKPIFLWQPLNIVMIGADRRSETIAD
jgi:hypothetical protein